MSDVDGVLESLRSELKPGATRWYLPNGKNGLEVRPDGHLVVLHASFLESVTEALASLDQENDKLGLDLLKTAAEKEQLLVALDSAEASLVAVLGELVRVRERLAETQQKVTISSLELLA